MENSRSKKLLEKVYDHLDTIEISKLSMNEIKDFLEVVQKGQFLESFGQIPPAFPFSGFGGANPKMFENAGSGKTEDCNEECKTIIDK